MSYNPATDFLGLWRSSGGSVTKLEIPGLDYMIAALDRAGLLNVAVSAMAPVANQSTTAWLQTAVPSYSGEGSLWLWDKVTTAYLPATSALLLEYLEASAGRSGVSWYTSMGGPPANVVGNNGDFAIRLDGVGGIYGPKALGAWPANPIPGSTNTIDQDALDTTFGNAPGSLIVRGPADWQPLALGADGEILASIGGMPDWLALTLLLDALFTDDQGSLLYRGAAGWTPLAPGVNDLVLTTHGPGADPSWTPKSSEFQPGTSMLFRQTAAPVGWTKEVAIDNYGLRVVSGAVGTTAGNPFSTVFSQTQVGNTTLTTTQMASHSHTESAPGGSITTAGGAFLAGLPPATVSTGLTGGNAAHTHSVNLSLAYTDVIIATKD